MHSEEFLRNRSAWTHEQIKPYINQHIAVSPDGRCVLAHASTQEDLLAETQRLGLTDFVLEFVFDPETSYFGGSLEFSDWDVPGSNSSSIVNGEISTSKAHFADHRDGQVWKFPRSNTP
jgi:hypothetical protein